MEANRKYVVYLIKKKLTTITSTYREIKKVKNERVNKNIIENIIHVKCIPNSLSM